MVRTPARALSTVVIAAAVSSFLFAPAVNGDAFDPDAAGAQTVHMFDAPRPVERAADRGAADGGVVFVSVDEDPEGDMPRGVAYTPDGGAVVIVHRDTDNVTFFDTTTNAPTHTVDVGDYPVDVAVTVDGRFAVVPNVFGNSVSIVDVSTHTLAATVPVTGSQPFRVALTPDSRFAVVGVINDGVSSSFSIIDLDTQSEALSFSSSPQGVAGFFFTPEAGITGAIYTQFALTPDGTTIVLPDRGGNRVRLYDRVSGAELADLAVGDLPTAVDVSLDSTTALISHEGSAQLITEIDVVTRTVTGTSSTAANLVNQVIRITPDKSHAIAAISNNVIFVNLTTGATAATINTGTVGDIEISFDGQYAFVSNFNARVIDIATRTLVDTIPFAACVDAATSPTELRAVALNNRFSERIHFYDINGAAGFLESAALSGELDEGDVPYAVDIAQGGSVAVSGNLVSGNASIIDLPAGTIRSYVDVGDRLKEVRITPDGAYAVVCSMETNQVVIIDLATDTVVAALTISNRPGRVRIAPDSSEAYVLNVAGTDRISFIRLDGASSQIVAQLPAGQTGSANGPTYTETSGIELSADGSVLAVCDSFNDQLRLYNVVSRAQVASVTVGDFPLRVAFSLDGTRAYVTNHFSDTVSVVEVDGAQSTLLATVPGVARYPITVEVDATGAFVYVGTRASGGGLDAIRVIDTTTNTIVRNVSFGDRGYPRDTHFGAADATLYAMSTGSQTNDAQLVRIDASGAASTIIDDTPLSGGPSDLAFDDTSKRAVLAQPVPDGVDIVSFGCPADVDGDGTVGFEDILALLAAWGPCGGCPEDIDQDGMVAFSDLLAVLSGWGACP